MKMKIIACLAFLLNTFLFGTYYSVSKEALTRIDPIVFTFFGMVVLAPVAICIIAFSWRRITREIIKSGALLGCCYCLGVFALGVALKYNTATGTAFFPSLNGLLAAVFAGVILRQPISRITWLAGIVSVTGTIILITNASVGGARGASIAFIGGLLLTLYVFLADREQRDKDYWPLLGVELLTIALGANLIVLLFGDWQAVHPLLYKDVWIVLYIAFGTNFLPTLITVLLQKYISPVTVSFIYILEPVMGAIAAYVYLRETLPLYGYVGGALIITGVIINTWGTAERPASELPGPQPIILSSQRVRSSQFGAVIYPLLCLGVGTFVMYMLGGFPPAVWSELYRIGPQFPAYVQQKDGMVSFLVLVALSLSWLVAWVSLIIVGVLAAYRMFSMLSVLGRHFARPKTEPLDALDVRVLRQMGVTPYTVSEERRRSSRELVQRRQRERRERLARIELVE